MSNVLINDTSMVSIGNAIRTKLGVQTTYLPSEMPAAILSIPTGGGGDDEAVWKSVAERTFSSVTSSTASFVADYAFYDCTNITSVDLPNVEHVGLMAFQNANISGTLYLPNVKTLDVSAFNGQNISAQNERMTAVDLPECISIARTAFHFRQAIQTVTLPKVQYMDGAFAGCTSLSTFTAGSQLTHIGQGEFAGDTSLVSFSAPNLAELSENAFYGCTSLTTLNVGYLTSIPNGAFQNCASLPFSALKHNNTYIWYYLQSIGDFAFDGCTSLSLDSSLTMRFMYLQNIGKGSFRNCTGITNFDCQHSLVIDGPSSDWTEGAFYGCSNLQTLSISACTSIGMAAFEYCTSLVSVNVNDVETIGNSAFFGCSSLQEIELPSATSIGAYAFEECTNLDKLVVGNNDYPQFCTGGRRMLYGTAIADGNGYIYVPDDLVSTYQNADYWRLYPSQIRPISDLN